MMGNRLFLLDFACVLPFGHNAPAVNYFRNFFKRQFNEVIPLVCKDLPLSVSIIEAEARQLPYLYSRNMVKDFIKPTFSPAKLLDTSNSVFLRKFRGRIFKSARLDIFEVYAIKSYADIFLKYRVRNDDSFFFHSASYYEVVGLLLFLKNVPLDFWPKVHVRFIGVLEFSNIDGKGKSRLYKIIREHYQKERKLGISKLFLSAEVPVYAQKLSTDLAVRVSTTFYPPLDSKLKLVKNDVFTIVCPGAGRGDKGFFELREILYKFYLYYPKEYIRLIVQSIDEKAASQQELSYLCQLRAIPGVEVMPHKVSEQQILEMYAQADLVLLPYSIETYKFRGSAVLQESISFCKPILSYDGSGFSDIIKVYQNGVLCDCLDDIVHEIYKIKRGKHSIADLELVRSQYMTDFNESYLNLWSNSSN